MNRKKLLKIIIPLCIVLIVAGIWIVKHNADSAQAQSDLSNHPEFALEADSIDLTQLTSYGLPIIIDFGADWCSPCREFAPIYEEVHAAMQGKAILKYVDVDKSGETAADFAIQVIPTQVFYAADGTPYSPGSSIATQFTTYNDPNTGKPLYTIHQGGLTSDALYAILADMGVSK